MDCTDCVTIWMTLTLRGWRCEVLQFLGIMSNIGRRLCWIFESRYVAIRTKILQETEILTICQFIRQIAHIHGKSGKRLIVYRDIWIYLGVLLKVTCTNWTSPDSLHYNITYIWVLLTDKSFSYQCTVLTDRLVDPPSETEKNFLI